jgi:hypothetical protein
MVSSYTYSLCDLFTDFPRSNKRIEMFK